METRWRQAALLTLSKHLLSSGFASAAVASCDLGGVLQRGGLWTAMASEMAFKPGGKLGCL